MQKIDGGISCDKFLGLLGEHVKLSPCSWLN